MWEVFRKYHYLNTELNSNAEFYIGIIENELVCCGAIIPFPMRKGWKRVHRLVVLPDYQGIGIGTKFITEIGKMIKSRNYVCSLVSSNPSIVNSLTKNKNWKLIRFGRVSSGGGYAKDLKNSASCNRITYSFCYKEER